MSGHTVPSLVFRFEAVQVIRPVLFVQAVVVTFLLLLGTFAACGGDGGDSREDRSERDREERDRQAPPDVEIPDDVAGFVPTDAEMIIIFDVSRVLSGDTPGDFREEFEEWASDLLEGDIDLDDIDALAVIEDRLFVAEGNFNFARIRRGLEETGYEEDDYRGFETWGERAALIESDNYVVLGFIPGAVNDLLQSLDRGRNLVAFESGSDFAKILDEIGSGDIINLIGDECSDADFSGCVAAGNSQVFLDQQDEAMRVRVASIFEDQESADDAYVFIEEWVEDDSDVLEVRDISADGATVVWELDVDSDISGSFAFLVSEGPVSGSVRPAAWEAAPTTVPAATAAPAPLLFEAGDDFRNAQRIRPGDFVSQHLGSSGYHFFQFEARIGRTYVIETDAQFDSFLELYDDSTSYLFADDDGGSGGSSLIQWTAEYSGDHYVIVSSFGGDSGSYDLMLNLLDPDDHAGSFDDATQLAEGRELSGSIEENDEDYFVFDARRDSVYVIETQGGFDTFIELYDDSGYQLASDDDGGDGGASRLIWSAPSSGNYYVKVRGFDYYESGSYSISLIRLDPDDHGNTMRSATRLRFDDQLTGSVNPGEEDYFEFEARRDRTYVFETVGEIDTEIELLDEDGDLMAYDDDGGQNGGSLLQWAATSSGRYYLVVRGYSSSVAGPYVLEIAETR